MNKIPIVILISILGFGCVSTLAKPTVPNNNILLALLEEKLADSNQIAIYHIPNIAIGNRLWGKENIKSDWKYKIVKKCTNTCSSRSPSLLAEIFKGSIRQINDCPIPLNTLVRLLSRDNKSNLDVYFNQSGHCFTIKGDSYYTDKKVNLFKSFRDV